MKKFMPFLLVILLFTAGWKNESDLERFHSFAGGTWIEATNHGSEEILYGASSRRSVSPLSDAAEILRLYSSLLRIDDPDAWQIQSVQSSGTGVHIRFQQTYGGYPVHGSELSMHFNPQGQLVALISKAPRLTGPVILKSTRQSAADSLSQIYGPAGIQVQQLVVLPFRPARLAWSAIVSPQNKNGRCWRVYLDARDVRILLSQAPAYLTFDGTATVWKENPVTTPERVQRTLPYLDATAALSGGFSKIYDANFVHDVTLPVVLKDYTTAKNSARQFNYPAEDAKAVEAMAYLQITVAQDRYKSLGFAGFGARAPIFVNVTATDGGQGFDNAYYSESPQFPKTGIYVFGAGSERGNTAKDADVLIHEYSHGVLDKISPALNESPLEGVYGFAIHEAFSDVAAAAINGNPKIAEFAFQTTSTHKYEGRVLQNTRRFPQNVIWPQFKISEPHYTSLILSGAWWDLQKLIGSLAAQKLFLQAAYLLSPDADFFDFRDAVLAADRNSGGTQQSRILQAFGKHGISGPDPAAKGTIHVQRAVMRTPTGIQSEFSRGSDIYFGLEYNATGIAPGYFFVPEDIQFQQPSGSNARLVSSLPEILNGDHTGANSASLMQVLTNSVTIPGSYSISFSVRRGCTDKALGRYNVSFTLK